MPGADLAPAVISTARGLLHRMAPLSAPPLALVPPMPPDALRHGAPRRLGPGTPGAPGTFFPGRAPAAGPSHDARYG